MGYVPPPPPPPGPRAVVDGFTFGLQVTKPGVSVGRVIMRGLGFGDQIAKLVPQEVGMIVTDAPGKPGTPGKSRTPGSLKCTYCGCVHRLSDLKSTANCPNCCGNKLVLVQPAERTLEQSLEARRRQGENYRLAQLLKEPDGAQRLAQALGPTLKRRHHYTESGGPR